MFWQSALVSYSRVLAYLRLMTCSRANSCVEPLYFVCDGPTSYVTCSVCVWGGGHSTFNLKSRCGLFTIQQPPRCVFITGVVPPHTEVCLVPR